MKLRRPTGDWLPVLCNAAPIYNKEGKITGGIVAWRDISGIKETQEILQRTIEESEKNRAFLEAVVAAQNDVVIMYDNQKNVQFVNPAFFEIYGFNPLGLHITEIMQGVSCRSLDGQPLTLEEQPTPQVLLGRKVTGLRLAVTRMDGSEGVVEVSSGPIKQGDCIIGAVTVWHDITERKRIEDVSRQNEARFRSILDNSRDVIYRLNLQTGRYEYMSPTAEKVIGLTPNELIAQDVETALSKIHPDDMPAMRMALARLEETGLEEVEYRQLNKRGYYHWLSNHMSLTKDNAGRPLYRDGNIRDITERKRSEEVLQERERLLQDVIDGSTSPIFLKDIDGKFITINSSLEKMLGMSREEIKGKTDYDIASKEVADYWRTHDKEVMETGKAIQIEEVADLQDGHHIFLANKFPLADAEGHLYGVGAISHDITDRKRAEEEAQEASGRFYLALSSMTFGTLLISEDNHVEFANTAFCEMFSLKESPADLKMLSSHEMLGKIASVYLDPDEALSRIKEIVDKGLLVQNEEVSMRGERTFLRDFIPIQITGRRSGRLWIHKDITERKRVEIELEATNKELESFAYSVSHDLRAPLRAIDGFSKILTRKIADKLSDDEKRQFDVIRDSTKKMQQLIEDLLSFSRLGRQSMSLSSINMPELASGVWEELLTINPGRTMSLKINTLPPAFGDRSLIRQVLMNLLSNAVKFTSSTENAMIEIGGRIEDSKTIFFVRDNGVGFDMNYHEKLFALFQRLHSQDEYEGTGAGLAIVQHIIHRHGGRVWAESEINKGATFYFSLPT